MRPIPHSLLILSLTVAAAPLTTAQDSAKSQAPAAGESRTAGKDARRRYILHRPKRKSAPKAGYKLLLVLPGGDGSAEFAAFVARIWKNAAPEDFAVAQLVAHKWNERQAKEVVWPTAATKRRKGIEFTTEAFIESVIKDVGSQLRVDRDHVYALGWSSGGPACYASLLAKKSPLAGAYIAMSVFHDRPTRELKRAKGKRVFLLHSPDDWIKIRFAETAEKRLAKYGAATTLVTYPGGHGWRGNVYGNLRQGFEWLTARDKKSKRRKKSSRRKKERR